MNEFYVYELIDPRNDKPFYIGKGKDKRMYYHYNTVINNRKLNNKYLENKLKQLISENLKPIYVKILESYEEKVCYELEIKRIKEIGKTNLCNLTDGGEGGNNNKGKTYEEIYGIEKAKEIKDKAVKRCSTKEFREKISISTKKAMNDPDVKKRFSEIVKSDEHRKKISIATKKAMTHDVCKKISKANSGTNSFFYGKKGKDNPNYGQIRDNVSGSNNGMYGKSIKDVWIEKHGIEIANEMYNKMIEKKSKSATGKGNPMYGKSVKDIWIEKYGIIEAEKKWKEKYNKI